MSKQVNHGIGAATVIIAGLMVGPSSAEGDPPSLTCSVAGETVIPADTLIYDAGSGGAVVAKLTGAKVPFKLSSFPAKLAKGRVKISTSKNGKAVRIHGFAELKNFRFFAANDLPVTDSPGIWITKGQQLELVSANAKGFVVEKGVLGSNSQKVRARIGCSDLSVELQTIEPVEVPKRARNYQMKESSIDLYDAAGGEKVFTLDLEEDGRKVFWSTEVSRGYVRVASRADITIDAWARFRDLTYSRHAELFDLASVSPKPIAERKLAIQDPPKVLTATAEIPIHRAPKNAVDGIGVIEIGARFYPMEKSGDWTNIMPETLAVLPSDSNGFWVRTAGLPKPKPSNSRP